MDSVTDATEGRAIDAAGWFGKVSSTGDFVHRRLTSDFIEVVDPWLSAVMTGWRERWGEHWLQAYLTAPVLRFGWAPGVVDAQWWFGLLMPSCDNVGRYFPLLIAQPRRQPPRDRSAIDHVQAWFDHLARAATQTLAEQASLGAFERALAEAPPWPAPGFVPPPSLGLGAGGAQRCEVPAPAELGPWLHAMAADTLSTRVQGCSIWWRPADAGAPASVSIVGGLPQSAAITALWSQA